MSKRPYQPVENAFRDGTIMEQSNETMSRFLVALSNQVVQNENVRHRDIIRGITINHILLQRHIDGLNKQNSKIQKWVIALAVAALISSVVQIFSPVLFLSPPTASKQKTQAVQSESPIQAKPQVSGQEKASKP